MATTKPDQPVLLATARSSVADIQALEFDTYGTVVDWRAGAMEALKYFLDLATVLGS